MAATYEKQRNKRDSINSKQQQHSSIDATGATTEAKQRHVAKNSVVTWRHGKQQQ